MAFATDMRMCCDDDDVSESMLVKDCVTGDGWEVVWYRIQDGCPDVLCGWSAPSSASTLVRGKCHCVVTTTGNRMGHPRPAVEPTWYVCYVPSVTSIDSPLPSRPAPPAVVNQACLPHPASQRRRSCLSRLVRRCSVVLQPILPSFLSAAVAPFRKGRLPPDRSMPMIVHSTPFQPAIRPVQGRHAEAG